MLLPCLVGRRSVNPNRVPGTVTRRPARFASEAEIIATSKLESITD